MYLVDIECVAFTIGQRSRICQWSSDLFHKNQMSVNQIFSNKFRKKVQAKGYCK